MKQIKKGDVLLIVGYESILHEDIFSEGVEHGVDMNDKNACPIATDGDWHIGPADVFYVEPRLVAGFVPAGVQTRRVEEQIRRRGYWWELRLKHDQPRRSK